MAIKAKKKTENAKKGPKLEPHQVIIKPVVTDG